MNLFFLLLLSSLSVMVVAQFLSKEHYDEYKAELNKTTVGKAKLNPLQELEDEVKEDGYSIFRNAENIDDRDEDGYTRLMIAAMRGQKDEVKHIVVQGANIELTNQLGETPLLIAVGRGHYYSTVELLKAHADIHHRNKIGLNSLHTAIAGHQPLLLEAILKTEESWATGIWKEEYKGPKLANTALPTGMTAVMMCAQDGQEEMLKVLLEYQADVNLVSKTGETALMYASITGNVDLVKILLRYKADPNFVNQAGFNMLMMAANRGHVEVVSRVILYCKDNPRSGSGLLGMKDRSNMNAMDHAVLSDQREVIALLMAAGAPIGVYPARVDKEVLVKRRERMAEMVIETEASASEAS